MINLGDQLILLFAYFYLVFNRGKLQTFFSDWKQTEEQLGDFKGIDPGKMKQTCNIIYKMYYIYNLFFRLFLFSCEEIIGSDDNDSTVKIDADLIEFGSVEELLAPSSRISNFMHSTILAAR